MNDETANKENELEVILTFIARAKNGEFAEIYKETLPIPRKDIERVEPSSLECEYFLSYR